MIGVVVSFGNTIAKRLIISACGYGIITEQTAIDLIRKHGLRYS